MLLTLQFQIEQYMNESTWAVYEWININFNATLTPPFGISQKDTENQAVKAPNKVVKSKGNDNQTHSKNDIDYPTDKISWRYYK